MKSDAARTYLHHRPNTIHKHDTVQWQNREDNTRPKHASEGVNDTIAAYCHGSRFPTLLSHILTCNMQLYWLYWQHVLVAKELEKAVRPAMDVWEIE